MRMCVPSGSSGLIVSIILSVENNGCLAVKPKAIKLTYAKTVRLKDTVEAQNRLVANGGDPADDSTTNDSLINDQVKVDIKTK